MEFLEKISGAFDASCREYKRILGAKFKPWSNEERLSIHETNQVANFLFAYKQRNKKCITWHELSVPYMKDGKNKTNHIDGFIIDGNNVVFIEAKRFSRVKTKKEELYQDLKNIVELSDIERKKFKMRLPNGLSNEYKFYCLLLADFWANRNMKADDSSDVSINWDDIVSEYKNDDEIKLRLTEEKKKSEHVWGKYNLYYALFELNNFKENKPLFSDVMEKVLKIAKQFINDPAGDYEYLGELEPGKHFVKYMFAEDYMDGDVALCVGGPQYLVVTGGQCRYADNDEYILVVRRISAQ